MGKKYIKKRVIIGILILAIIAVAAILLWPYYSERKYTGAEVELTTGLSAVETVESYLDYYGNGDVDAVMSFRYRANEDVNYLAPSLWLVKDVTIESITDVTPETDFTNSLTGSIDSYDKACVKVTYTIDKYFKDSETIEDYYYFLIQKSADSPWLISDQGLV